MFFRSILFGLLGYYIFKTVRQWFFGTPNTPKVKNSRPVKEEEDFQKKNQSKIEDADFEELD
jgi:hypothetical protein